MARGVTGFMRQVARTGGRIAPVAPLIAAIALPAPAMADAPAPFWQGVRRVQVLCLVTDARGSNAGPLRDTLCRAARDRAAIGAPVPVTMLAQPGAPVLDAGAVTLLVHASVTDTRAGALMAVSVRPYRNQIQDGGPLFGTAPRAALIRGARDDAAIAALVGPAIDETLPWHPPAGPRRVPGRGAGSR